jgi:hypothetical protein
MSNVTTTQTTTYLNETDNLRLVIYHNGDWAEYAELISVTDQELNRYPTYLDIKTANDLLDYWNATKKMSMGWNPSPARQKSKNILKSGVDKYHAGK